MSVDAINVMLDGVAKPTGAVGHVEIVWAYDPPTLLEEPWTFARGELRLELNAGQATGHIEGFEPHDRIRARVDAAEDRLRSLLRGAQFIDLEKVTIDRKSTRAIKPDGSLVQVGFVKSVTASFRGG